MRSAIASRCRGEQLLQLVDGPAVAEQSAVLADAQDSPACDSATSWYTDDPSQHLAITGRPAYGGLIVAPWMPAFGAGWGGFQLRLDVIDSEAAVGRFLGIAGYMMLRSQRVQTVTAQPPEDEVRPTTTRLHLRTVADADPGALLFLAGRMPTVTSSIRRESVHGAAGHVMQLSDLDGESSAVCTAVAGAAEHHVVQHGDRRLWDEAFDAGGRTG